MLNDERMTKGEKPNFDFGFLIFDLGTGGNTDFLPAKYAKRKGPDGTLLTTDYTDAKKPI
jgi:hypothetical protein